jgi:regulation of enolase protein 1 (concanavalin A-like superfamily)
MRGKAKKKPASSSGTSSHKRKASDAPALQNALETKANATAIMMSGAQKLAKQAKAADYPVRTAVSLFATSCSPKHDLADVNKINAT